MHTAICDLRIRKRARSVALVPNYAAGSKLVVKVVASPDDLIFRHSEQFIEVFCRRDTPFLRLLIQSLHPYGTDGSSEKFPSFRTRKVRRIHNRQVEVFILDVSQGFHAVHVVKCIQLEFHVIPCLSFCNSCRFS